MAQPQIANSYPIQLTKADFTLANTALTAGTYIDLYTLQVPAKQIRWFGEGNSGSSNSVDTRGTWTMDVKTSAPASIPGNARLVVSDANRTRDVFIRDVRSEQLSAEGIKVGFGGRNGQNAPFYSSGQDAFLIIKFKADSTATASSSDSMLSIPSTIQNL